MIYKNWIDYWNQRGKSKESDLKKLSGYDHKLAKLSDKAHEELIFSIIEKLKITISDEVLDVGCGAGVITTPLSAYVGKIIGVDAAPSMIQYLPPRIEKCIAEANKLPFKNNSFDKVLCHSVFQYFPNLKYAEKAIIEMFRVCRKGGMIYIMDIPDEDKREAYLRVKEPDGHNLKRLFYKREFFRRIFPNCEIFNHELEGYLNAKYRFNVLIKKS